jgi:hypothetical protein
MKCRRVIKGRERYWNIKGWGHLVVVVGVNCLSFRVFGGGYFEPLAAPRRHHSRKGMFCG